MGTIAPTKKLLAMKKKFLREFARNRAKVFLFMLLVLGSLASFAQGSLDGNVTSADGKPLANVTVQLKGARTAVVTNAEGHYHIAIQKNAPVLVFSYVGYTTQEVNVGKQTTLNVVLQAAANSANEVVVVGYGTQKRSDITGAVVSVPKARLSELPVTNVLAAIEGSVPGITVTTTSSIPGSTPSVLVRGQNSISAGTGPYIVVDGIPLSKTGGSVNDINPNDIASVEILKDASAVAIYGVNGTNGVILITTKRGTTGKAVIRYNGYGGTENNAHILQPRDAAGYLQKYADYYKQQFPTQTQPSPVPNLAEVANYNAGKTTDWIKEVSQQGIIQDHNINISGGSQDVKYFVSGEYLNEKGPVKGYQYQRVSFRSNLDVNVTNFLTVGVSLFYANNNYDGGRANLLQATAMSPYGQEYNADGSYAIYPMNPELLYTNPLLGLNTDQINRTSNLNGNGYAEIKFGGILKGLKYRMNAGYTYFPTRADSYVGRNANSPLGTATVGSSETNSYTLENILSYAKDWSKNHIDFTGLYSAQQRKYFTTSTVGTGFVNDLLSFNNLATAATLSAGYVGQFNGTNYYGSYQDRYAANSQMARINYSYDSRYLFTVTARRDGSSVFGANTSKYAVFPSVALGWNISNEIFMKSVTFVNRLKLRGSYGKTGNEGISVYGTVTTDNSNRFPFNGISTIGVLAGNLGNTNLQWETTKGTNVGLDFALFKSRITGSIDAYSTTTTGILLKRNIPIITGYANVLDNLGETSNKGIEVLLTTRNIDSKDFRWETTLNFSANTNKIVDLYGDKKSDVGNRWFIGQPINVIYDYQMTGVWQTGEDASKQDATAKPGDLKFADINHDGKISADSDKVVLGQLAPKWTGGITNTFHYKSFNLNIFIQTAQGITKNNTDLNYVDESGRRNTPAEVGYWTSTNANATRPALTYFNTRGYGYASNASYTRLKDITLSYVMSSKISEKLGVGSVTIYASGRNLATWTPWVGWDPENNYVGRGQTGDANNYPNIRSVIIGANISLK